jgi:diacylglycerol kinase family enzyme
MATRTLLVGNPTAQSGKAQVRIDKALRAMARRGMDPELLPTEPAGATVQAVARRLDRDDMPAVLQVVYLGGDGTFREVASGILTAKVPRPLGMLPSGTANNQGKSFGIRAAASALEENLDTIQAGFIKHLDVGRIERLGADDSVLEWTWFFDSAGFGMQSEVLVQRNRDRGIVGTIPLLREFYRDQAVYAGAMLSRLIAGYLEPTRFAAEVTTDGTTWHFEDLTDLIVSGTPVYAGEWVLDRESLPDDGLFELVPMQGRRDMASKALLDLKALPIWREHVEALGLRHTKGYSGSHFDIHLLRPERALVAAQLDGEEWGVGDRYRIDVLPRLLPIIVPAGWVPTWW